MEQMKPWNLGKLEVSPQGRYLQNGETPFFWLGDTGWLLFEKLNSDEAGSYLKNRRQKGYNVIQAMVIHKLPVVNYNGREPFFDNDLTRPDTTGPDSYWAHVEEVMEMSLEEGLYMALVPAWGENIRRGWLKRENVIPYMEFLMERLGKYPNIIWMVGGDISGSEGMEIWDAMGSFLRERCPQHLITFHPSGCTDSSQWFHNRPWLDFNMFQSGHYTYAQVTRRKDTPYWEERSLNGEDNWKYVEDDLKLKPAKPTLDAEPCYEEILKGLDGCGHEYWKAPDIRRFAYWSVFAGAMGFTYGHNSIMQFHKEGAAGAFKATWDWREALHHPAGNQMGHLRRLMEDVGFASGHPAQGFLDCEEGELQDRIAVFAGSGWTLAYTPTGRSIKLRPGFWPEGMAKAAWFDPVSGVYSYIGAYRVEDLSAFTPPRRFDGSEDWVLVLEEAGKENGGIW